VRAVSAEKGAGAVGPRVFEQLTAARRLAARLGETLGLDPFAFSRLKAVAASAEVTAMSLAELSESGRRIRLSAEARLAEVDDVGTDELVDDEFDDDEDET